jgi:phage FluMu protein Com
MFKTICWLCNREFEYNDKQYRDINCPYCRVENSIYNPQEAVNTKEENNDNFFDEENQL